MSPLARVSYFCQGHWLREIYRDSERDEERDERQVSLSELLCDAFYILIMDLWRVSVEQTVLRI